MSVTKADILIQLQREILSLQGGKSAGQGITVQAGLSPILSAFPMNTFPIGAVHEFLAYGAENNTACSGFISGILASLMQHEGVTIWVSTTRKIFPPALKVFGIDPERVVFIDLRNEKDVCWAVEESLKCNAVAAVVGEMRDLSFTASRRLQLAVENSRATGFILRNSPRSINTTACVSRWQIASLPGEVLEGLPGVGYPRWHVQLLKVRNGKPGSWDVGWRDGRFQFPVTMHVVEQLPQKKTG